MTRAGVLAATARAAAAPAWAMLAAASVVEVFAAVVRMVGVAMGGVVAAGSAALLRVDI